MAAKVKALQQWCKFQCDGYRDVNVVNMTSSWKSGLAFCAIIHRYRPDLIDYDSLSKENVFENNKLAFDVAQQLGIPALLDAEDMVVMTVPDKLCIITYVSQYYNYFRSHRPASTPMKRHLPEDTSSSTASKKTIVEKPASNDSPAIKILEENKSQSNSSASSKRRTLEDTCNICQSKVFLMERQIEGNKLYHRHCLRTMQKEQSASLRSPGKSDDRQQRRLDQSCKVQNRSMECEEEYCSDVASGGTACENDIQFSVSRLDTVVSSGSEMMVLEEVTVAVTHGVQVTSSATVISSAGVTSVNKSVASLTVVTSAIEAPSISSAALSAISQPKAGATSSPVMTSGDGSCNSRTEEITCLSDKSTLKPTKPVDSAAGKNQSVDTSASHALQPLMSLSTPVSSNQPTELPPLISSPSSLSSNTSTSPESPSTQLVQAPLRPKLPPTIIPQQSGASTGVSPSTVVPSKPPRSSIVVETPHVESSLGPYSSLAETSDPSLSHALSSNRVVSFANYEPQKPHHNISPAGVGDSSSALQTTATTVPPPRSTSAHISGSCYVLAPKSRPAPNPPDQPALTSVNLPVSTSTKLNFSVSVSPSVPATTLRSILTLKSHPAPCPPNDALSSSTTSSTLTSVLASAGPSVSTSEKSLPTSATPSSTASTSFVPMPSAPCHVSTPAVHPLSTPTVLPLSNPADHDVSCSLKTTTGDCGGYSGQDFIPLSKQNAETAVSHSSTSHVNLTQSIKLPVSYPGRTPPSRPAHPPSGLSGHTTSTSKLSLDPCTYPEQSCSTPTTSDSASSILHPNVTLPSNKSVASPPSAFSPASPCVSVVPPTSSGSSEAATMMHTKQTSEQIMSEDKSQNVVHVAGQSVDQSSGQPFIQSGVKHPPIPKRPPSILVSREVDKNKHLPTKLENALDQKLIVNPGSIDNQEWIENKEPLHNETLINGASAEPKPRARKSVRPNPFNNPEQLSPVKPEDLSGNMTKDQTSMRPVHRMKKEPLREIQELPKKDAGGGDISEDVEKAIVKPSPTPRSTIKPKGDAPSPPPPTIQSGSTWYVDLELEDPQNETGSAVPKSIATPGPKLVSNESGPRKREESLDQQKKATSIPVPRPRSRSRKGNDASPVSGSAQPRHLSPASSTSPPQLSSPERNSAVQPSTSIKMPLSPADGTTSQSSLRSPPPRPTPPRPESIQQARKKITPDTTFTFEDQTFNFGPTSGSKKPSDGRELHMRSSAVASKHNQPVVKRKVNAENRLSPEYIKEQLQLLDSQLKKLEREGRILEDKIRSGSDESMDDDDKNDLMGQWFEMVNHKNDLVRLESELIYRCRQQELEDKHEELEFELRCLMNKPNHLKTANEKKREDVLLQKLLQTVTQRNNIVESMEEDRIRYLKEDEEIAQMLTTSRLK